MAKDQSTDKLKTENNKFKFGNKELYIDVV